MTQGSFDETLFMFRYRKQEVSNEEPQYQKASDSALFNLGFSPSPLSTWINDQPKILHLSEYQPGLIAQRDFGMMAMMLTLYVGRSKRGEARQMGFE